MRTIETVFERFGFFRSQRLAYDDEYQWTRNGRIFLANRWNIWMRSHNPDGSVIPMADREPGRFVYHTNVDFPDYDGDIWKASQQLVSDWDDAFRDTVAIHKNLDKDGKGSEIQFALDMDLKEQIHTLEFLGEFNLWFTDSGGRSGTFVYPMKWLARLYVKEGDYKKTDQAFMKYIPKELGGAYDPYRVEKEDLEFLREILVAGKHDPSKLKKVRQVYEDRFGEKPIQPAKKQRG